MVDRAATRTRFGRRSAYNLSNAVNYARLAFKAASRDQNLAEETVRSMLAMYPCDEQRLLCLAVALHERVKTDYREKLRSDKAASIP